jgi:hypothetical protein
MLDKFGGDSLAETLDNLQRYRDRIAAPVAAPVAGGQRARASAIGGQSGEAGSGGDD